mgnify:CR=1 FL=1
MKKAQISAEFFILVGLTFLIALAFEFTSLEQLKDFRIQKESEAVKDLAVKLQRELLIAAAVEDGYVRVFKIPDKLDNINYSLATQNSTITVQSRNSIYIVSIPKVIGNASTGLNEVKKINGVIYLNAVQVECANGLDDDFDTYSDTSDPSCYMNCDYLTSNNYMIEFSESTSCSCSSIASCCLVGIGTHYTLFDSTCGSGQCWSTCLLPSIFTLRNNLFKVMTFADN